MLIGRPAGVETRAEDLDSERDALTGLRGEAALLQAIAATPSGPAPSRAGSPASP